MRGAQKKLLYWTEKPQHDRILFLTRRNIARKNAEKGIKHRNPRNHRKPAAE